MSNVQTVLQVSGLAGPLGEIRAHVFSWTFSTK